MEKKKPTIDEIYKINVDGLFESTANWFDNAFKKSQAEINRDLYNKINGYSSSSESTGGNVSLGPLLTSLNGSNLYPSRGYLYYNGNDWEFNTPTISGGGGGGVVDTAAITKIVNDTIKNISWWGQKINNNKVDGSIVITKGSHSFTIELDDNGNLKFNGNVYATGGITALGVGTTIGSGSGVSLGTLLTKLNSDNPFPTDNGQVLTYDGTNFVWKTPTGSGGNLNSLEVLNKDGSTFFNYNGETAYRLRFGNGLSMSLNGDEYVVKAMGGTTNISEYSWWGRKFNSTSNSITGEMSSVTSIEFQSTNGETVIKKKLHLDNNGNLCFDGNFYATGGITAFGSSGSISGGGSNGGTTGILYFGAPNKNLGFNGSKDMSLAFGDGLKVEKNDSQITVSAIGGVSGGGSIQVAQTPEYSGENESWVNATKLRFIGITGTKPTITTNSNKGCVDVGIPTGGGSGSSSRISNIKLFNSRGSSFETVELGTADTIGFMAGDNVTLQAVVKEYTNVIKISSTGGSGGSGGSTSTSISWENVTNKPSTFTPSSHTHQTSDITGLSGVKVNNATHADNATKLLNSRLIWGQSFDGTSDINGNLKMGSAGGGSIQLWMNNGNMLDRTNNTLHIGNGLKGSSDGEINFDAYKTVVYTDNMSKHYDFKSNVFDVNSNQIHFGSETNGGKISWDSANNAFKIEGNVYATGGITALGVSNNATTNNNVDFTFRSVTANTFNVMNSIQLSDGLKLERNAGDFDLVSIDGNINSFYFDGNNENYYLNTNGEAFFSNLDCESLSFSGVSNFKIVDAGSTTFTIQFEYNRKTYQFTPSGGSVTIS